jgi:hypothetical protein
MKNIITILATIIGLVFSQEFEVDGNLRVTGSVESSTIDSLNQVITSLQTQIDTLQSASNVYQFNSINLVIQDNNDPAPHVFDAISLSAGVPVKIYYKVYLNSASQHNNSMSVSFSHAITSIEGVVTGSTLSENHSNDGESLTGWNIGGFTPEDDISFIITVTGVNTWDNSNNSATSNCGAEVLVIQ